MLCEEPVNSYSDSIDTLNTSQSSDMTVLEEHSSEQRDDKMAVGKLLNKGKFEIYLVHTSTQNLAAKFFPFIDDQFNPFFVNEMRFAGLQHQNVLSISTFTEDVIEEFRLQKQSYILMELAPHGDFLDLIIGSSQVELSTKLVRTYFQQLIEGLEYLHSVGISHLDLKLDNLLIGKNYQLKIADFDQSYKKGDHKIISKGTVCHRAPELAAGKCKNPEAADIYSAGVILFVLYSGGKLPYQEQRRASDPDLLGLLGCDPEKFFKIHCDIQGKRSFFFSEDFKALFTAMLRINPSERATISQIKGSNWYNGPTYNSEELVSLMEKYV